MKSTNIDDDQLSGIVKVNEASVSDREMNKHGNKKIRTGCGAVGEQAVIGMRE